MQSWKALLSVQTPMGDLSSGQSMVGSAYCPNVKPRRIVILLSSIVPEARCCFSVTPFAHPSCPSCRELAIQISEQFHALGAGMNLKVCVKELSFEPSLTIVARTQTSTGDDAAERLVTDARFPMEHRDWCGAPLCLGRHV